MMKLKVTLFGLLTAVSLGLVAPYASAAEKTFEELLGPPIVGALFECRCTYARGPDGKKQCYRGEELTFINLERLTVDSIATREAIPFTQNGPWYSGTKEVNWGVAVFTHSYSLNVNTGRLVEKSRYGRYEFQCEPLSGIEYLN